MGCGSEPSPGVRTVLDRGGSRVFLLLNEAIMGRVFAVYAAFWFVVILGLLIAVGLLLKSHDRAIERRKHDAH